MVTADDFGIGEATSQGIVEAAAAGAIHRTSVMMVTGDHLARSLPLLQRVPELPLGLHLTLCSSAGRPLVATRASGLVDRDGYFCSLTALLLRARLRGLDRSGVREEVLAQCERFQRLTGKPPGHVDGHQHVHELPGVREVVAELIGAGLLPKVVRCTTPPAGVGPSAGPFTRLGQRQRLIHRLGRGARPIFAAAGAVLADGFLGIVGPVTSPPPHKVNASRGSTGSPWAHDLDRSGNRSGVFEMMVHPGRPDPTLAGRDPYVAERPFELAWLLAAPPAAQPPFSSAASTNPTGTSGVPRDRT